METGCALSEVRPQATTLEEVKPSVLLRHVPAISAAELFEGHSRREDSLPVHFTPSTPAGIADGSSCAESMCVEKVGKTVVWNGLRSADEHVRSSSGCTMHGCTYIVAAGAQCMDART